MDRYRTETYRLHSKLPAFKRRVQRSLELIEEALADEPASYVSWSGGKDSMAMLHLVRRVCPDIPILHVRTDIEYPDCEAFVDRIVDEWSLDIIMVSGPSAWDILVDEGGPFGQVNVASSRIDRECFFEPLLTDARRRGFRQAFVGLRKHESRARLLNRAVHGVRYYHKGRDLWQCTPLGDWDAKDVFAYHAEHGIPLSPIYDKTHLHPDPERIREGWWTTGETAHRHGMGEWLRYHYPGLWRRAVEEWPQFGA